MNNDFSASEAARILGVSLATLYSYVSRNLLAPISIQTSRSKRYPREDVLRLAARMTDAKRGGHMATAAMHWGVPVLETSISRIADGQLYYRGYDARVLADQATLETTACILWDDSEHDYFARDTQILQPGLLERTRALTVGMAPLERALALLPMLAQARQYPTNSVDGWFESGVALMRILAAILLETEVSAMPLHQQVGMAWGADAHQCELIRATLVLLADHELNASAFTVRCVASTGAGPVATLSAGLAALSGPKHGGSSSSVKAMLNEALAAPDAMKFIASYCAARDAEVEGYGHKLYPAGDPRAAYLLDRLAHTPPLAQKFVAIQAIWEDIGDRLGMQPNADLALAVLEIVCGWPDSAGMILFALARSVGWIAHAAEQASTGAIIRPRARYVGRYRDQ